MLPIPKIRSRKTPFAQSVLAQAPVLSLVRALRFVTAGELIARRDRLTLRAFRLASDSVRFTITIQKTIRSISRTALQAG